MSNVIYAYKKRSTQKIVYVGQSVDLPTRHKTHMEYDPFNVNCKEYNYPLSRGIRKYGENEYELIILEDNVPQEKLNDREKYWIAFYDTYFNGYNQTIGGSNPTQPIFTEDKIDLVIEMLQDESYSYQDIIDKTGISMTHIYNINTGARRRRNDLEYPIRKSNAKGTRGLKLSPEENQQIQNLLKESRLAYEEIADQFNCKKEVIANLNRGETKAYRLEGWEYPIRDTVTARKIGCEYRWRLRKEQENKK